MHGFNAFFVHFFQGREQPTTDMKLAPILAGLSKQHAEAVKQRVKVLNRTVRGRTRSRNTRKPDIRDVFRDIDVSILLKIGFTLTKVFTLTDLQHRYSF